MRRTGDPTATLDRGTCRDCGREIVWAESEKGNATPLDPEPLPPGLGGTFALEGGVAYYVESRFRNGGLFRFHGLSCPAREQAEAEGGS